MKRNIIIIAILAVLAASFVFLAIIKLIDFKSVNKNSDDIQTYSKDNTNDEQNLNSGTTPETKNIEQNKPNYYSYDGKTLFFEDQKPNIPTNVISEENNYPVYLLEGTTKTTIIKNFHPYCPICYTEFKKTSLPEIPLLLSSAGDLAVSSSYLAFINLNSKKYFSVNYSNQNEITTVDDEGLKSKIKISIEDNCKDSDTALLKDILVDDAPLNFFETPLVLKCNYDHEFGPDYVVGLHFASVNQDWSKVFFYISGSAQDKDFRYDLSFNIKDKKIIEEKPTNILYNF